MSDAVPPLKRTEVEPLRESGMEEESIVSRSATPLHRIVPSAITLTAVALAALLGWLAWGAYMETPWTRDGTVRADVVTMAPEVSGRIVELRVADNQFVHKGDVLLAIDPTDYRIAVSLAEAAVQQADANLQNAEREAARRLKLSIVGVSIEQQQIYATQALTARAQLQQARATLDQARVNLERSTIRSPVSGWVTNLLVQRGDYATAGQSEISVIDSDSFWIDGYFAESELRWIRPGDRAEIKLMGYSHILHGTVASLARGINVANAQPNQQGLAQVNPIFTWVRLAQRIPVRIRFDRLPADLTLVAGMTATVQIEPSVSAR